MKCAKEFGTTQSTWAAWENGIKTPSQANQAKLAAFFGTSAVEVWGDEPHATLQPGKAVASGEDAVVQLVSLVREKDAEMTRLRGEIDRIRKEKDAEIARLREEVAGLREDKARLAAALEQRVSARRKFG